MTGPARTLELLEMLLQQDSVQIMAPGPYVVWAGAYGFQRTEGKTLHEALEKAARKLKLEIAKK